VQTNDVRLDCQNEAAPKPKAYPTTITSYCGCSDWYDRLQNLNAARKKEANGPGMVMTSVGDDVSKTKMRVVTHMVRGS
jgi:hypothetical protein